MTAPAHAEVKRVLRDVAARLPDLFRPDARVVVAVSGGQDSTCLLHALTRLRGGPDLVAAHVDHALRPESAAEAASVIQRAEALGISTLLRRVDAAAYRQEYGRLGIEHAARIVRYEALASVVAEVGAQALLVGHTADDQAETVLLHLLRGTGLTGLVGMRLDDQLDPARLGPVPAELAGQPLAGRLRVVRPLLRVPRTTTLAYCQEERLELAPDPSNDTDRYARNRIRRDLLPHLEQYNSAIKRVLARTADLASDDEEALQALAEERFAVLAEPLADAGYGYDRAAWRHLPRALQRRLLRRTLLALTGRLEDVRDAPIEDVLDVLSVGDTRAHYDLPGGATLDASAHQLHIRLRPAGEIQGVRNTRMGAEPCV
ncbi:MAG: tRNA lysidine(34) synthetase TilS [Chloroflexi bacterium]|nr:tRNA lysidine(34) synthetase TilS [Chloroflexota bacterium]